MKSKQSPQQRGSNHGRCRVVFLLLFGLCCLTLPTAGARVIFVHAVQTNNTPDGSSWAKAFPSVQQAIDTSAEGDELWVAASIYFENIRPRNGVALYGGFIGTESQLEQRDFLRNRTILDGGQTNRVVEFASGATNTTRLDGFVIRNGIDSGYWSSGAGILCSNTSPVIINNFITQNLASAIFCVDSSPLIASNRIQQNMGGEYSPAGGIECLNSGARIHNNRIIGNVAIRVGAGGILCAGPRAPEISGNLILANINLSSGTEAAGAINVWNAAAQIINNTVAWHQKNPAISCSSTQALIANNILTFNRYGVVGVPGMVFQNNCVFGNSLTNFSGFPDPTGTDGNIAVDPGFAANIDFPDAHLTAGSPCRDAGSTAVVQPDWIDLDGDARVVGKAVDIGADEFDTSTPPFIPAIIRVSPVGNDANNGSSWATAKRTIQAAIDEAAVRGGEVWVKAGIYDECTALRHFVYLYGGFAGTEANRHERDWRANPTILDGGQRGVSVITADYLGDRHGIDGFVIRNGKALRGGGIFSIRSSTVIANNTITGNAAPGCPGGGAGGGIYLEGTCFVTNNVISFNNAALGAGICSPSGWSIIANNRIEQNVATVGGSSLSYGTPHGGGGIYAAGPLCIANNFFLGNIATNAPGTTKGGYGGAVICLSYRSIRAQIYGNTFIGNLATSALPAYPENGGAICDDYGNSLVANNLIVSNSSGIHANALIRYGRVWNNCIFGNGTNYLYMPDLTGINSNISLDPLLAGTNDFHLAAGSACINAGDDSVVLPGSLDLDDQVRIAGAHVDIGADEYGSAFPFRLTPRVAGLQLLLSVNCDPNRTYVFESSPDLVNWVPFKTNCATNSRIEISVPRVAPGASFYRAKAE